MPTSSCCTGGLELSCGRVTWYRSAGRLRGFIVSDFYPQRLQPIRAELAALVRSQRVRVVVSEFDGLNRAPEALASVFDRSSPQLGKRVVRISAG